MPDKCFGEAVCRNTSILAHAQGSAHAQSGLRGDAPTASSSLCHCTPDKSGNGDNGGYYEQPPNQPEDADKYERSDDDSKENSY